MVATSLIGDDENGGESKFHVVYAFDVIERMKRVKKEQPVSSCGLTANVKVYWTTVHKNTAVRSTNKEHKIGLTGSVPPKNIALAA